MHSDPLVVTFADSGYRPLLEIWLRKLSAAGMPRLRIYALDAALQSWCEDRGVETARIDWHGDLRALWVQRIRVFSALLAQGETFVHSDTDALWIQDALHHGSGSSADADLLFSQGTVWPPDVHARWGFVLCCGWFRARATPGARAFFAALERDVLASGDDQVSVNRLLLAAGIRWERGPSPDYQIPFGGKMLQCWTQPLLGTVGDGSLSVALLPHREFQRLPESFHAPVVKHYLSPKSCAQKLTFFQELGLLD